MKSEQNEVYDQIGESDAKDNIKSGRKFERHKHGTLFVVTIAYFLDCMLITVVVPILPHFLTQLQQEHEINTSEHWIQGPNVTEEENLQYLGIGYILCTKPLTQLFVNLFAGPLTRRIGYSIPMLAGFIITLISIMMFAVSRSFWMLFTARSIQGVGSAFTVASGMGMLAKAYNDDDHERGRAMGLALAGVSFGLMAGPVFGGFLYNYGGIYAPFGILAGITVIAIVIEIILLRPKIEEQQSKSGSLREVICDPQVIITALGIAISNFGMATTEPTIPLFIQQKWGVSPTLQGLVFLPSSLASAFCSTYFEPVLEKMGRWLAAMIGLLIIAVCVLVIPLMPNYTTLLGPVFVLGWGVAMAQTALFPTVSQIVDARHENAYGVAFAIADSAVCLAFTVGPSMSEALVKVIGLDKTLMVTAGLCVGFMPFLLFLRTIKPKITVDEGSKKATDEEKY
ncbi:unnamed protein product [Bursaphelenchus okinawaensis]|uniref:Major facilitator superfamily (MFS) profile domain-containing protein n=1 Tax=Bursaphelenchus okinawaensis TaxID=465554 RepID=A0A811LVI2_9BILA|nr:unnamed protein product [Bursaphelenchus okinawaensis]CAG9128320.1 unnamed protein product [Bursaphelenchus okinawaensis]